MPLHGETVGEAVTAEVAWSCNIITPAFADKGEGAWGLGGLTCVFFRLDSAGLVCSAYKNGQHLAHNILRTNFRTKRQLLRAHFWQFARSSVQSGRGDSHTAPASIAPPPLLQVSHLSISSNCPGSQNSTSSAPKLVTLQMWHAGGGWLCASLLETDSHMDHEN